MKEKLRRKYCERDFEKKVLKEDFERRIVKEGLQGIWKDRSRVKDKARGDVESHF